MLTPSPQSGHCSLGYDSSPPSSPGHCTVAISAVVCADNSGPPPASSADSSRPTASAVELFLTTLSISYFKFELFNVNRGKDIFTNYSFRDYNSILEVISLPRHECNLKVSA